MECYITDTMQDGMLYHIYNTRRNATSRIFEYLKENLDSTFILTMINFKHE